MVAKNIWLGVLRRRWSPKTFGYECQNVVGRQKYLARDVKLSWGFQKPRDDLAVSAENFWLPKSMIKFKLVRLAIYRGVSGNHVMIWGLNKG